MNERKRPELNNYSRYRANLYASNPNSISYHHLLPLMRVVNVIPHLMKHCDVHNPKSPPGPGTLGEEQSSHDKLLVNTP